jgi:hypothetical protein
LRTSSSFSAAATLVVISSEEKAITFSSSAFCSAEHRSRLHETHSPHAVNAGAVVVEL